MQVQADRASTRRGAHPPSGEALPPDEQAESLPPSGRGLSLWFLPWQSVGERVLRELQWEVEGGMPEWGDLLLVEGGTDRDRAVAAAVQPGQTARRGLKW